MAFCFIYPFTKYIVYFLVNSTNFNIIMSYNFIASSVFKIEKKNFQKAPEVFLGLVLINGHGSFKALFNLF